MFTVTLDNLSVSEKNVRKVGATDVADLLASIPVHGLLQNYFLVEPTKKKGKFAVIAGGRRITALKQLAKEKKIAADYQLNCAFSESVDIESASLAENANRAAMHPVDQFRAFAGLIERGASIEDAAAQFNVTVTVVKQRLKLAQVAPEILDAYVANQIGLAEVTAYAISDDQERQRAVFATNPEYHSNQIRRALTDTLVPLTDRRVKFVTVEAYEKAGGAVRRDLFSAHDHDSYIEDAALLDKLYDERMGELRAELAQEGWADVVIATDYYSLQQEYRGRIYPKARELTEDDEAELSRLAAEQDELSAKIEAEGGDDNEQAYADLEAKIEEINGDTFDPEEVKKAVAAIVFEYGTIKVYRGLTKTQKQDKATKNAERPVTTDGLPAPSAALAVELAAVRTAMVAADLADNPHVALAATVHAMASEFLGGYVQVSALQIKGTNAGAASEITKKDIAPLEHLAKRRDALLSELPKRPSDWWHHFVTMEDKDLLNHLAYFAAMSLKSFGKFGESHARVAGDLMATSLKTEPKKWATLSDLNFFARSSKTTILGAVERIKGKDRAENLSTLKKADLAARANQELDGFWLPVEMGGFASDADWTAYTEKEYRNRNPYAYYANEQEDDGDEAEDFDGDEAE